MNRPDRELFDQRIADWLEDDPNYAPRQALDTVLAAFSSIPQRRARRAQWRPITMFRLSWVSAAIVGVAVVIVAGALILRPGTLPGIVGASPSPSVSPSPSAASPLPSASVALTEMFTSDRLGYSARYPKGWDVSPATEPWAADGLPLLAGWDVFNGPDARLIVTSRRLATGESPDTWPAGLFSGDGTLVPPSCHKEPPDRVVVAIGDDIGFIIDSACGSLGPFRSWSRAIATVGGRAYVFQIDGYDHGLFEAFLGAMALDPSAAVDQPN